MLLLRCYQLDNHESLSYITTPPSQKDSAFPSHHQLHRPQGNDSSNELSSSKGLPRSISRPSHMLVRSTSAFPRQRRDRFRPSVESDAVRYLSQFASQLPHISSRTRRLPIASRSATSISTMATASSTTSMTTSSAPSLIHTPTSSLDVSATGSPTRPSSNFLLHHQPSFYSYDTALATNVTRSTDLLTPTPFPSDKGSMSASVPTIKVEAQRYDSTCYPAEESECKANTAADCSPIATLSSMPTQPSARKQSFSPLGIHARKEFAYNKQATSLDGQSFRGNLKQLLDAGTAQMSM